MDGTAKVYDTLLDIFGRAKAEDITTAAAADRLAEDRIQSVARIKRHLTIAPETPFALL